MKMFTVLAFYDPSFTENIIAELQQLLAFLNIEKVDEKPIVASYKNLKELKPRSIEQVKLLDLIGVTVGMFAETANPDTCRFGISINQNSDIDSTSLIIAIDCPDNEPFLGEVIISVVDKLAEKGLLGYGIGFTSRNAKKSYLDAVAITYGEISTLEEEKRADAYGRFRLDTFQVPKSKRKYHSGLLRGFYELNILDEMQFNNILLNTKTKFIVEKYFKKQLFNGYYLFIVDKEQLLYINTELEQAGFLI